jgi:glucose/arabinose dehydrogenase
MAVASNGDVLVVERESSIPQVRVLWDDDGDGVSSASERTVLAQMSGLNHGIAICNGFLFASSDTQVYRWLYTEGSRTPLPDPIVVVHNINADGKGGAPMGHRTRTLAFDAVGNLYISVGSMGNVDADSHRSRIRKFPGLCSAGDASVDFQTGETFADGLRNEVGLAFNSSSSSEQVLFGVENGPDKLEREDLGGDIHNGEFRWQGSD